MKIGFYNPYFDSLGGGERYVFTLASHWSIHHDVSIFWDDQTILKDAEKRFNLSLHHVQIKPNIFTYSIIEKLKESKKFDVIFVLSDGSIPLLLSKRAILHFQVPFKTVRFPIWKKRCYQSIVCNSEFTARSIDPQIGKIAQVVYPPVDTQAFRPEKKVNIILSVGRFSSLYQAKKQEILIQAFQRGYSKNFFKNSKLILAGGVLQTDRPYYESLTNQCKDFPIEFYPNCSFDTLKSLYGKSKIYWHAAGFNENQPEFQEHFGITSVEAMASGAVPIIFNGGGQPEVVRDSIDGYLWNTIDECIEKTQLLLNDEKKWVCMSTSGLKHAQTFDRSIFEKNFDTILNTIVQHE